LINSSTFHFLRQRIPFFIFILYLLYRNTRDNKTKIFSQYIAIQTLLLTGYLLYGWILKIPIQRHIGFKWTYFAAFEWAIFLLLSYTYSQLRHHNPIFTITFMAQAASAGGWLYEIPYFLTAGEGRILSTNYVLLLNFQIISTLLLPVLLDDAKIKLNKKIVATTLIYLGFALFNYFTPSFFTHYGWLQRLPTMLMLLTLLSGIPKWQILPNEGENR